MFLITAPAVSQAYNVFNHGQAVFACPVYLFGYKPTYRHGFCKHICQRPPFLIKFMAASFVFGFCVNDLAFLATAPNLQFIPLFVFSGPEQNLLHVIIIALLLGL